NMNITDAVLLILHINNIWCDNHSNWVKFKDSFLAEFENVSKNEGCPNFHEKNANELWKITIDYRNAAKEQWDKLKQLNKEDLREYSSEQLKDFSITFGKLACEEYREACKIADKAKQLKKQVKLRGNMALCLYVSEQFMEAQVYALSAIHLQFKNSQNITQEFVEAKNIYDKVKGGDTTKETSKPSTEISNPSTVILKPSTEIIKPSSEIKDKLTLMLVKKDQELSLYEKKNFQGSIGDDLGKIGTEFMINANRDVVRYKASRQEILHAKCRAQKHITLGTMTISTGAGVGIVAALAGFVEISEAAVIIGAGASLCPVVTILAGVATLGLGIWGGKMLWKRGNLILEEPKIREKLNQIMVNALAAYDHKNYQEFLIALSTPYVNNVSLLKFETPAIRVVISPEEIIDKLINHGFRSDGIAYLLNLIGEVLISGKIKLENQTMKDLKALAKIVFDGVLNKRLVDEAVTLDNRIRELRKSYQPLSQFRDFFSLEAYRDIAQENKDDARKMPFQSRLEEMRNTARINIAIFYIMDTGDDEREQAIKIIKAVRDSINTNFQFVGTAKLRLEVLEDFLWVISGSELPEESIEISPTTFPKAIKSIQDIDNDEYVLYLNNKLQQTTSYQEKIQLYNDLAANYEQLAEKEDKINKLMGLRHWHAAQKNYENARRIDSENPNSALGYAKCLLKLSKYTQLIQLPNASPSMALLSDYWRLCSIAYCKQANYDKAEEYITEALIKDNNNILAVKQRELIMKLGKNRYKKEEKKSIKYEEDYFKNSRSNESPVYNILSIDGGGIRGVLPALWLKEIENRSHRPISHLFNMIAGTSTGGFTAAGLSVPYSLYSRWKLSDFKPKFSASDILNTYLNESRKLFATDNTWCYFDPKYTDKSRSQLFKDLFSETKLSHALTKLIVPTVNENDLAQPHLFKSYNASSKNDTFYDALMATTASPTFFSHHNIKNKGVFLDGGVLINNPTITAYTEATQYYYVAIEKISVLSLGTGCYTPDPLRPDLYLSKLFWQHKHHKVALTDSIDCQMHAKLGDRYQRWQVWLENPIGLDDFKNISNLLEIGYQYIEELDDSDENPINKLVESLQKSQNIPNEITEITTTTTFI
ncbi:21286_t:CDS:1, partial [Gigaspora rosea]